MPLHLCITTLLCVLINQYWTGLKCVSFIVKPNCMKYRLSGIEYCCQARYKWERIPALLAIFFWLCRKSLAEANTLAYLSFLLWSSYCYPHASTPFNFWSTGDEGKNEEEWNSNINYSKDISLNSCLISATHISFFVIIKTN